MIDVITNVVLEGIVIFLTILTGKAIFKVWKSNKNRVNAMMIIYILFLAIGSITRIQEFMGLSIDFTIGAGFQIYHIFGILIIGFQFAFTFYIKEWKRFYYFPLVMSIFVATGLIQYDFQYFFIAFALLSTFIPFALLLYIGIKNRNGVVFMLAVFILVNGIALNIRGLVGIIIRIVAMVILFAGTSGFVDKYLLIDKKEKLRLQNVWISKIM
ncbi:MAG: hypothetical protein E3J90_08615 [Promethearchaeota archaeon]|nr:MAG: hypothetical protein E3J90_08615 [Candidatus Lokiarchaeota archaeon]